MIDCIFCKIVSGEVPKEFVFEDKDLVVFDDIYPIKPTHLLIVPKKHIKDFYELNDEKIELKINKIIKKMIKEKNLENKGFKVFLNGGGAQIVDHLHIHLSGPWSKGA